MPKRSLTIADAGAIAEALPGVTAGVSYGTPAWRVGKKFLMREKERMDNVLVLRLASVDDQELLIERDPDAFFITEHYCGYPAVLLRLGKIDRKGLTAVVEQAWRSQATKKLIAEREK